MYSALAGSLRSLRSTISSEQVRKELRNVPVDLDTPFQANAWSLWNIDRWLENDNTRTLTLIHDSATL